MAFLSDVHGLLPVNAVNSVQTLKVPQRSVRAATGHELCHALLNELKVYHRSVRAATDHELCRALLNELKVSHRSQYYHPVDEQRP
jgi:hypothetical protein